VAVIVLGGTALVLRQLGLPMLASQSSARAPRFWWMLSAFLTPLGVANQVLFCDGLFLQLGIITLVAGSGIWVGDRLLERLRS
jgi:hypothetical protein